MAEVLHTYGIVCFVVVARYLLRIEAEQADVDLVFAIVEPLPDLVQ